MISVSVGSLVFVFIFGICIGLIIATAIVEYHSSKLNKRIKAYKEAIND